MIHFFGNQTNTVFAVQSQNELSAQDISKLNWLFQAELRKESSSQPKSVLADFFVGPRASMITPWSTNAVEISQNMGIAGIERIEEFFAVSDDHSKYDSMLQAIYKGLDQGIYTIPEKQTLRYRAKIKTQIHNNHSSLCCRVDTSWPVC